MKAGFIGLGLLGKAMAGRLIAEGVELTVWNRTREKASGLKAEVAENPAAVSSSAKIIFLNLTNSEAVKEVIAGKGGLIKGDIKGRIIVDTSTNNAGAIEEFYRIAEENGASYLEAPVLGSVKPASEGNLEFIASGDQAAYQETLPYLQKLAKKIFYVEGETSATRLKLLSNMLLGTFMAAIAEAVLFGEYSGLDRETVVEVLSESAGNSYVFTAKKQKLLNEDFSPQFKTSLLYKDLNYVQDMAKAMQKPLFTPSVIKELYALAISKGMQGLDFSSVYKLLKEIGASS